MAIQEGFDLIKSSFTNVNIFGEGWIIGVIILVFTMLLITRDYTKWGELMFPVLIGWRLSGVYFNGMLFLIAALLFAITLVMGATIGDLIALKKAIPKRTQKSATIHSTEPSKQGLLTNIKEKLLKNRNTKQITSQTIIGEEEK